MALKVGNAMMAQLKGGRGLAHNPMAYLAREDVTLVTAVVSVVIGQPVTPGEETALLVSLAGLRANADVKRMQATLHVADNTVAEPTSNTLSVQEGQGTARTFVVSAQGPPGLSNVALRLDPGEVFWTHRGLLAPGDHAIPVDFAEQVNAYLDRTAHGDGPVTLKFGLTSDTPGRVRIQITPADYAITLLQTQTWPNELDGTLRVDRNLTLDFNSVVRLPLTAIPRLDGRATALTQLRMDVSGQLGRERLLESTPTSFPPGGPSQGEFATVSGEYSLARGFVLDPATVKGGAIQCAGFSAFVRVADEAEIYAELQVDLAPAQAATGVPSAAPAAASPTVPATGVPLAHVNQVLAPPPEAQAEPSERWIFVPWDTPAEIQVGVPYWVVLKGVRGQVYLGLRSDPAEPSPADGAVGRAVREERLRINRGGQLWKALRRGNDEQIRARLGLVYTPGPDNSLAAVKLSIEGESGAPGPAALIDPAAQATAVPLDPGGPAMASAVLLVQSSAVGALTIANVIQEYQVVEGSGT